MTPSSKHAWRAVASRAHGRKGQEWYGHWTTLERAEQQAVRWWRDDPHNAINAIYVERADGATFELDGDRP